MNWSERRRDERVKTEGHLAGSAERAYDSYLRVVNLSPRWAWSLLEKERKKKAERKEGSKKERVKTGRPVGRLRQISRQGGLRGERLGPI